MNITKNQLLHGSLIAAISHAIMTNIYPELAYEQSWDGNNYLALDSQGLRGIITFLPNYCVGAIRNENNPQCELIRTEDLLINFPKEIAAVAREETLQYMLVQKNGTIEPAATSMFWADMSTLHFDQSNRNIPVESCEDMQLFYKNTLSPEAAFDAWKKYYDMPEAALMLAKRLTMKKRLSLSTQIFLSKKEKSMIPGDSICEECEASMHELNIVIG